MRKAWGMWCALTALGCTPDAGETTDGGSTTAPQTTQDGPTSTGPGTTGTSGETTAVPTTDPTSNPTGETSGETSGGATSGTPGETTAGPDETTGGAPARLPAEVIDLTNWKLTLPIAGDDPDKPLEIFQPELATYTIDPWYVLTGDGLGVRFRANAGGVTTSNSGYPRTELREMQNDGADLADWSTTEGVHTMTITQAIMHLPEVKPHVVAGQIHDDQDDVVMIRLEDKHLFVEGGGEELGDLDANYQLGAPFTVRLRAAGGVIEVYYQDMQAPAVSVARDAVGCYFKAGVYTQSNPDKGDDEDAYGEVVITDLVVTHE